MNNFSPSHSGRMMSWVLRLRRLAIGLMLLSLGMPLAAQVVTTLADNVASPPAGSLRAALNTANASGSAATITFNISGGGSINLAGALPILRNPNGISIDGANGGQGAIVIDGGSSSATTGDRIFFLGVRSSDNTGLTATPGASWTISNLTLQDGNARGGAGGNGGSTADAYSGGGGGAGLGGALFVNEGNATLSNVQMLNNRATGGNGGGLSGPTGSTGAGGGMGGNGGSASAFTGGGGGGFGVGANGGNGNDPTAGVGSLGRWIGGSSAGAGVGGAAGGASGGGGGGASSNQSGGGGGPGGEAGTTTGVPGGEGKGGNGGFGGGGGAGGGNNLQVGGNGGYGGGGGGAGAGDGGFGGFGGGGGGGAGSPIGAGGFGGGNGAGSYQGGGGGAGLGAAVFVRQGATLALNGGGISGGTVTGGSAGPGGAGTGLGIGDAAFLAGPLNWSVATGQTVTLNFTLGGGTDALISGGLTKSGPGTLVLNNINNYVGSTAVSAGQLRVNADSLGTGAVSVASGATLSGTGTLSGATSVASGGTLAPGQGAPGRLSTANMALVAGATFAAEITGTTVAAQYDQLRVNGTINLGGATLALSGAYVPTIGQSFVLIDNDGSSDAVTGTFTGLPQGGTLTFNGVTLTISYVGGDGNNVVLSAAGDPCATFVFPYTLAGADNTARLANLRQAIQCANSNGAGSDTINLNGQTVDLPASAPFADYSGQTALPQITSTINIRNGTLFHDVSMGGFLFRTFSIAASGTLNLQNMELFGNSAPTPGGAFHNSGTLNVTNSTMHGYDTSNRGGVLYNASGASANFANALFYDNNAVFAHVMDNVGTVTIVNSTFDKHVSVGGFGAILEGTGYTVRNSILWNPGSGPTQISTGNTVSDSIVKGGYSGGTNILNTSPLFVNEGTNDFRIQLASPAVNVGVNTYVPVDTTDVDGDNNTAELRPDLDLNPRIVASTVDMGAYERQDAGPPDPCPAFVFPYTLSGVDNTARVANLRQAIQCANANGSADTIDLNGQTVTMADSFADYSGATSLPQITSNISLQNGTLTRSGASLFRIVSVSAAGSLTLRGTTISNGGGAGYASLGAGIHNLGTTTAINTNIVSNTGNLAVAIYSNNTLRVVNSTIAANSASSYSAILEMSGTATIANTVISGNRSTTSDNISINSGTLTVSNSTVAYNYTAVSANNASGAFYKFPSATLIVQNSIIWGNRNSNNSSDQIEVSSGSPTVSNSIIEGGIFGSINADPLFVTPIAVLSTPTTAGDFQLNHFSPAIDAGANANVPVDTFDVDGDTNTAEEAVDRALVARRYNDSAVTDTGTGTAPIVDIGAYERQTNSDPCAAISFPYTLTGNTPVELRQAISCANANGTADVINLNGQTITLTDSFANYSGNTGLPQITTNITVRNGTITRSGANEFRFFNVSNTGALTVRDVVMTNAGGATFNNDGGTLISQGTSSTLNVVNSTISGSQIGGLNNGSGVYSSASFSIVNSSVVGGGTGRGAIASGNGPVLIQNTLVAGNSGPSTVNGTGGVYLGSVASATIVNSTIVGNYTNTSIATQSSGIFASSGTVNLTIRNSIIWGNRNIGNTSPQVVNTTAGTNTVTSSLIEGGTFGALNSDPLFLTPITASATPTTAGNFQLGDLSPAVDAGANVNVPVDTLDVDGDSNTAEEAPDRALAARRYNDTGVTDTGSGTAPIVDLGAYEKQTNSAPPVPAVSISLPAPGSVSEDGASNLIYTVTRNPSLPTATTVNITTAGTATSGGDYIGGVATVVIPANASTATITLDPSVDSIVESNETVILTIAAGSGYTVGAPPSATGTINNDDTAAIIVTPTAGLVTTEAGGTASFSVVLTSQPTGNVTIGLSSSDTTEGTVGPTSLLFTSGNWNVAQTVTVTGADDVIVDGSIAYSIVTAAATSADSNYNGVNPSDVSVSNSDNDTAGITVSPTAGLVTTEAGGTATFTVVLGSQPTGDVTVGLSSSDTTEGTVGPTSLVFTSGNWNVAQTVTVTGVDDPIVDGSIAYSIVTAAATSADSNYSGVNPSDVSVSNSDNDTAGITVSPTAGLITTEAGGTASFSVVLTSQPTGNVTVGLSSSDTTEGTVGPTSLVFTSGNWNVAQTVTITGVDDLIVDGSIAYSIVTAAATSADGNYSGVNASDVSVSNSDNDTAGITVSPTAGLVTTEAGGTATFTVVLGSQPTGDVTVGLSSSDTTEGTVGPTSLVFTSGNWNVAQTVTVTGVDDPIVDGSIAYSIVTAAATSADSNYSGVNPSDVSVSNSDNDTAGITVSPTAGLITTEAGGTASFSVVLTSQPTGNVTVGLSSSDTTEGTVGPTSLVFTSGNWNVAQTVTITGVDDLIVDGSIAYSIVTAAATSADGNYSGVNANDVSVSNSDNDSAGVSIVQSSGTTVVTEGGATDSYTAVLTSQPSANVTLTLSATQVSTAPTSLTFTSGNWNIAQTVTVTAIDDAVAEGNHTGSVTSAVTSADSNYGGISVAAVSVAITDNDNAAINVSPTSGLTTTEAGGSATFTVVLGSQPTANVSIGLSSSDSTEGSVAPTSLTFSSANWNVAQTVTITGVDDPTVDGNVSYNIVTAAATSSDANYSGVNASDVSVSNSDNDSAAVTVVQSSGTTAVIEGGTTDSYTVALSSQPSADVTIALTGTQVTTSPTSLSFTPANWNIAQTVTVTAIDDAVAEGNHTGSVTSVVSSADSNYGGISVAAVSVAITDNDNAAINVSPTSGLTTTEAGGSATFTVVLGTQPTANVSLGLSSSDSTEGSVAPTSLTFSSANWNVAQTVTITGVDDLIVDGSIAYSIVTAAATSADSTYNGVNPSDVTVSNSDNDSAGVSIVQSSGTTVVTEGGATDSYTAVLTSQPSANVTLTLSATQVSTAPTSLTFTSGNWNIAQTVTVTAIDDAVAEGNHTGSVTSAVTSADSNYGGISVAAVSVAITDNDNAAINVSPTSGLTTTEAGGSATFTVVLGSQPTANVSIGLSSSDSTEGSVAPTSLTFSSANWNVAQTVTITGVDDATVDGNVSYNIVTAAATSSDANYSGINASDVSVSNSDNDSAGVSIVQSSGTTVVTEGGATDSYTVALSSQPSADVTIALTGTQVTTSPTGLIFTSGNWNIAQTVTVTAVDDAIAEGNHTGSVTSAVTSADGNYSGISVAAVSVAITDNDSAAINVSPTSGLTTTEAGGSATFAVVLGSQPTANVSLGLSSSDSTEGSVAPTSLTFSSANWNVAQTVTITGVDDATVDGNVSYSIVTAAATSSDANYSGVNASDVSVSNSDNDSAAVTVVQSSGTTAVIERGTTDSYTVALSSQPSADVTIALTGTQVTTSPTSLSFTAANWNIAQTVTVTAIDDAIAEGNHAGSVTSVVASADSNYSGISVAAVSVAITDNDNAAINVSPTSGLTTTEAGGSATFTVVLGSQPTANVSLGLSSSDSTEGSVAPTSLTFNSANWNVAQTVTITGVDDATVDGNVSYNIVTAAATSSDANYSGVNASDVSVSNSDNDSAGVSIVQSGGTTAVTEGGATDSYTVALSSQPTGDVSILITPDAQVTRSPISLTFTPANWDTAQTVTVTAIDDAIAEGAHSGTLSHSASGGGYSGIAISSVTVAISDNDSAGITVTPTTGLTTTEAGGSATFSVQLTSQPSANVSIGLSSSDSTEGTVAPTSLSFTSANWNLAQTVTVTGVDDAIVDGSVSYNIVTAAASSADSSYNGLDAADVSVSNSDDDTATVSTAAAMVVEGDSGTSNLVFTLQLAGEVPGGFTVNYQTRDNTATAGVDYVAAGGTLNFDGSANSTRTISILVNGDTLAEAHERLWLDLSSPNTAVSLVPGSVSGEIVNDDLYANVAVTNTWLNGSLVPGAPLVYEVTVSNQSSLIDLPQVNFAYTLTPQLTGVQWTCVADPGATCPASGTGAPAHTIALGAGTRVVYRISAIISPTATQDDAISTTATANPVAPYSDPDPSNNSATARLYLLLFRDGFEGP